MWRAGAVLLLLTPALFAEKKPPEVVLLLTKTPPSSRKKFEKGVARAFGAGNLDAKAKKALRASYRWSDEPAVIDLPLGSKLELRVGRKPLALKNAPKHRAWISLRALNRDSVDTDYRRILRILSEYVEGNKSCTAVYIPEHGYVHLRPEGNRGMERLSAFAGGMRARDPLLRLGLKKKLKRPPRLTLPRELSAVEKASAKRAQEKWVFFVAAWNAHEKFTERDYWVVVKYTGPQPGTKTTLVKIESGKNGRFYGECAIDDKTIAIFPPDVVDWWYRDKNGKWVGKFMERGKK